MELLTFRNGIPFGVLILSIYALRYVSSERQESNTRGNSDVVEASPKKNKYVVLGVILAIVALLGDCADSLFTTFVLTETQLGFYDYTIGYIFVGVCITIFVYFYLWEKNKKPYNPFRKNEIPKAICTIGNVSVQLLYGAANEFFIKCGIRVKR